MWTWCIFLSIICIYDSLNDQLSTKYSLKNQCFTLMISQVLETEKTKDCIPYESLNNQLSAKYFLRN